MFPSFEASKPKTLKVAKDTKDNPVTELIYWVRMNLNDQRVHGFTKGRFDKAEDFSNALKLTIQDLGIIDERGKIANFSFFISGEKKGELYLAGIMPLTDEQKKNIKDRLGFEAVEVDTNLYHLEWK
jgi:hypothetical protein